jgi:hypothetical protein
MNNRLKVLIETYPDIEFLSADGFEDAIIGISGEKIVYSITKCIDILMTRDGMNYEEAEEYFVFNVEGAYVGEKTPIWVYDDLFINSFYL